jgi:hypothetical protein
MNDLIWIDQDKVGRSPQKLDDVNDIELATPWNPSGNAIDLARASMERKAKRSTEKPPEGEMGSAWDRYRIYAYYQDGMVFENGPIETADYEEMLSRDGKARMVEQALTLPMRSVGWTIEPAKGDAGEHQFVMDALTKPPGMGGMKIPIETVIGQMTTACLFKRAHFEKVFRIEGTKVTYEKIAYRPPTTCYLARSAKDASFQGFMQWTWEGVKFVKIIIPKNRAFVYLHGAHRNPLEGISDLDVAYNAYQSKQKLRFLWYNFCEVQSSPQKLAKKGNSDEPAATALAQRVAKAKGGAVIGLIEGDSVEVLESNGLGAQQFQAAMAYLDYEILDSTLLSFLGLAGQAAGAGGAAKGSNALSEDLSEFYLNSRQAVLKEMGAAITHDIIRDLVIYNFGVDAACPTFKFGDLAQMDGADNAFQLLQAILSARTPTPLAPYGFIDELVEKVATYCGLDTEVVREAVKGQNHAPSMTPADDPNLQPPPGQALHGAINAATQLVGAANGAVATNGGIAPS